MGTWGHGSFENDDALDWLAELEAEGLPAVGDAIGLVLELEDDDYLELPEAASALAAAEIVAALRGQPASALPEEASGWVARHGGDPGPALAADARRAIDRILRQSELAEVREESGTSDPWRRLVADLRARLS